MTSKPDGSGGDAKVSVAQFSPQESALLEAEERPARVSAVQDVLALLVVPEVAALDARRLVPVEGSLVEAQSLNRRLHDFLVST
jgi:hypothetical protein